MMMAIEGMIASFVVVVAGMVVVVARVFSYLPSPSRVRPLCIVESLDCWLMNVVVVVVDAGVDVVVMVAMRGIGLRSR